MDPRRNKHSPANEPQQGHSSVEPISLQIFKSRKHLPERTGNPLWGFLAAIALLAVAYWIMDFLGSNTALTIMAFVLGTVLCHALIRNRLKYKARAAINLNLINSVTGARLRAQGNADELIRFTGQQDVPFEPAIFERIFEPRLIVWGAVVGFTFAIATLIMLRVWGGSRNNWFVFYLGQGFGAIVAWIIARLRPTYYRIVPGRLDIMRFNPLTNRAWILVRWNLKVANVNVEFDQQRVCLFNSDDEEIIRLSGISEPYKFVEALFQGAISTYPAPPLPDDRLLG